MRRLFTKGLLNAICGFARRDVEPRLSEIVFTQDFALSVAAGIAMAWLGPTKLTGAPKLSDIATGFLAYAAIALGFCVGGMTIALTLPDREFVKRLATLEVDGKAGNGLSGLLFVFTWTAVVHWLVVVSLIIALIFDGGDARSFVTAPTTGKRLIIGAQTSLCSYALFQFLITVLTLAHVGLSYINELRSVKKQGSI
jgi:hypothetical protein